MLCVIKQSQWKSNEVKNNANWGSVFSHFLCFNISEYESQHTDKTTKWNNIYADDHRWALINLVPKSTFSR